MEVPIDKEDMALFNAATRVQLGNGARATFWTSHWLQGNAPTTLFPALFNHSKRKNRSVREALIDNRWIGDVDHNMTSTIIMEFMDLWARLQDIVLLPQQEDKIIWLHTSDGQYTTKSAYEV
jgi:hypothetical protein